MATVCHEDEHVEEMLKRREQAHPEFWASLYRSLRLKS